MLLVVKGYAQLRHQCIKYPPKQCGKYTQLYMVITFDPLLYSMVSRVAATKGD
jgi:hypothetical protein